MHPVFDRAQDNNNGRKYAYQFHDGSFLLPAVIMSTRNGMDHHAHYGPPHQKNYKEKDWLLYTTVSSPGNWPAILPCSLQIKNLLLRMFLSPHIYQTGKAWQE